MQSLANDEVKKLTKSSESDESRQPVEKFESHELNNLMKSLESDESRQPDEKLGK